MPPKTRRTITYNLTDASSRDAFEHGLDYHEELGGDDRNGNGAALLGSSPGSRGPFSFADSSHRLPSDGMGRRESLLDGRGSTRHTADLINLIEIFPAADRTMLEEVYAGCACVFDDALDSLSALLACEEPAAELEERSAEAKEEPQEECSQAGGAWLVRVLVHMLVLLHAHLGPCRAGSQQRVPCVSCAMRVMHHAGQGRCAFSSSVCHARVMRHACAETVVCVLITTLQASWTRGTTCPRK